MTTLRPTRSFDELAQLRRTHYNARVESRRRVHDDLLILRVLPDGERPRFLAGQYTLLGLGNWERRIDGISLESAGRAHDRRSLIRRAYSISCPVLDEAGRLVTCDECPFLEFYITLVHRSSDDPPLLTPRLFALQEGDRLFLGPHPRGRYTLEPVRPEDNVVFVGTGTGEAPHNAMIAELLSRGHQGRIVSAVSVRFRRDLGYLAVHRELQRRFANYRYLALTTREPENIDPSRPDYAGRQHLQDYFATGRFEKDSGLDIEPGNTHVYLCGNPAMIGLPDRTTSDESVSPKPLGMVETLVRRGFQLDEPRRPGNIHFERYW